MANRSSPRAGPIATSCSSACPRAAKNGIAAFPVRFVYEVPSPHPGKKLGWRGKIALQPPQLGSVGVLQSKWTSICRRNIAISNLPARCAPKRSAHVDGRELPQQVPTSSCLRSALRGRCSRIPANRRSRRICRRPRARDSIRRSSVRASRSRCGGSMRRRRSAWSIVRGGYSATVEALACLLAFALGVSLLKSSRRARFHYFIWVGLGALIIAGAVDPRGARFWETIYLGVFLAVPIWLGAGLGKWFIARRRRPEPPLFVPPMNPPPVAPPPPADAPIPATPRTPAPPASKTAARKRSGRPTPPSTDPSEPA